ncbi:MAG: hypothetical protein RBT65_03015 [Methanolobus sp.]|nr:hypothetical protein [Methanolobus sp.]
MNEISYTLQRNKNGIIGKLKRLGLIEINVADLKICDACSYREDCTLNLNKELYYTHDVKTLSNNQQNNAKSWKKEEISLLKSKFSDGATILELSAVLQKNQQSIDEQLIISGLISCRLHQLRPELFRE